MRLICTLDDQGKAQKFAVFLHIEGIDNQVELITNGDWGSDHYGDASWRIWVYDEDQQEKASELFRRFIGNPDDPMFTKNEAVVATNVIISSDPFIHKDPLNPMSPLAAASKKSMKPPRQQVFLKKGAAQASLTIYLILICFILFIIDMASSPTVTFVPTTVPAFPLLSSPLQKELLYDYPEAYEIVDQLAHLYSLEQLQDPGELPEEGRYLYGKLQKTPYWQGLYPSLLADLKDPSEEKPLIADAPLFEKLRQGEVWRTITPSLMHSDILHILFNMLWLLPLGQQMEVRLGSRRYLFFILLTAIISNTCQYLMGGSSFLGFSGVLCAMLSFIWMRQRVAAWEGYPLERSTIHFLFLFIAAMFFLQSLSFFLEAGKLASISPGMANTAHIAGVASGLLFGRLSFFNRQR